MSKCLRKSSTCKLRNRLSCFPDHYTSPQYKRPRGKPGSHERLIMLYVSSCGYGFCRDSAENIFSRQVLRHQDYEVVCYSDFRSLVPSSGGRSWLAFGHSTFRRTRNSAAAHQADRRSLQHGIHPNPLDSFPLKPGSCPKI